MMGKKGVNNGINREDINRKMQQQMNLNRKLFGEEINNYTAMCESELDESLMNLYHEMKKKNERNAPPPPSPPAPPAPPPRSSPAAASTTC